MNPISLLPTRSSLPDWDRFPVAAEALEPRIAPASLTPAAPLADVPPQPPDVFLTENAGLIVQSRITIFDSPAYKGTIESFVVRRTSDTATLPIGGLDFYYQVALTSGLPSLEVSSVTLSGLFQPFLVAAGRDPREGAIVSTDPLGGKIGGTQAPVLFSYSAGLATFDFGAPTQSLETLTVDPDRSLSGWLVLRTTARSFEATGSAGIFGSAGALGNFPSTATILTPKDSPPEARALVVTGAGTGSEVRVFDPATGMLKESFNAFGPRNKYGVRVATGDVNGDGVEDIIVGSGRGSVGGAHVRVFDGADPLHPALLGVLGDFKPFGSGFLGAVNVASGDVNEDGFADIIVAPAAGSSGEVRVFSGESGMQLSKFAALSRVIGGVRIAAGDINGDGRDEVIVGSGVGSAVRAFSIADNGDASGGRTLRAFELPYKGGVSVAAGDTNGDGIAEIIVGKARDASTVRIYDFTQTKIGEFETGARNGVLDPGFRDGVRLSVVDSNQDGFAEIVAGKAAGGDSAVSILLRDGEKLRDLIGYKPGGKAGAFVG